MKLVKIGGTAARPVVEIDHPPVNVLSMQMLEELLDAFAHVRHSGACGMFLKGAGKCFSAGADVAEHLPPVHEKMIPLFTRTIVDLMDLDVPTVAFVHGSALGGGLELALACDAVVATETARLGLPEIVLGVYPPVAAAILPLEIGSRRALELLLTGDPIEGPRAAEIGLVNRVGNEETASRLLERMTRHPRPALVACKRAARRAFADRLAAAERIYLEELMSHPEPVEGLTAFVDRRRPSWEKTS